MHREPLPEPVMLLVCQGGGGVRDYADAVCRQLPAATVATLTREGPLPEQIRGQHIVLQYSGYGFARRGTPLWLPGRLREMKRSARSVSVYFHELFAGGPPWRSAFWLSPWQRGIVRALAQISDFWLTNRAASGHWIAQRSAPRPHAVLPVFSNVGEPGPGPHARSGDAVVFGSSALRSAFYRQHGAALLRWMAASGARVHDIGAPVREDIAVSLLAREGIDVHGMLAGEAVSALMQQARFGLIDYPLAFLAKSSVFAAYCAHGLAPVVFSGAHENADGLVRMQHYLPGFAEHSAPAPQAAHIAQAAWAWYQPHRAAAHAQTLQSLIARHAGCAQAASP